MLSASEIELAFNRETFNSQLGIGNELIAMALLHQYARDVTVASHPIEIRKLLSHYLHAMDCSECVQKYLVHLLYKSDDDLKNLRIVGSPNHLYNCVTITKNSVNKKVQKTDSPYQYIFLNLWVPQHETKPSPIPLALIDSLLDELNEAKAADDLKTVTKIKEKLQTLSS